MASAIKRYGRVERQTSAWYTLLILRENDCQSTCRTSDTFCYEQTLALPGPGVLALQVARNKSQILARNARRISAGKFHTSWKLSPFEVRADTLVVKDDETTGIPSRRRDARFWTWPEIVAPFGRA